MFLFRGRTGRGWGALINVHEYVWEHIHVVSYYYKTALWMFTKPGRGDVLMAPHMFWSDSARSAQGRIQGMAKIGHRVHFFKKPLCYAGML